MFRAFAVPVAILLWLVPAMASAGHVHKRHLRHRHPYGFLPGYHPPPNNTVPIYGPKGEIDGPPDYAPNHWYNGDWYYPGRPGFFRNRYNGGSFGPCWTLTPIGLMWNCGK